MIIALGYRVQSDVAVRFRIWATKRLHEYIRKGFTLDDDRLKQGGNRYFRELLQRIRNIRSSERNFYQQVTDIYATFMIMIQEVKLQKSYLLQFEINYTMQFLSILQQNLLMKG